MAGRLDTMVLDKTGTITESGMFLRAVDLIENGRLGNVLEEDDIKALPLEEQSWISALSDYNLVEGTRPIDPGEISKGDLKFCGCFRVTQLESYRAAFASYRAVVPTPFIGIVPPAWRKVSPLDNIQHAVNRNRKAGNDRISGIVQDVAISTMLNLGCEVRDCSACYGASISLELAEQRLVELSRLVSNGDPPIFGRRNETYQPRVSLP